MTSTSLTVLIAAHRAEDADTIVQLLAEHGCAPASPGDPLVELLAYGADDVCVSAADNLAGELIKAAPFTAFEAYTEPTDEFGGHLVRYAPVRGRCDFECAVDGSTDDDAPWAANA